MISLPGFATGSNDEGILALAMMAHPATHRPAAETLAARLPGLLIQAERIARTIEQGIHGRRRSGVGETFWQFRPYQPGEDAKRIDWRQSAKTQDLYVREQEWEAAQSVWLGCDLSGSMNFSSDPGRPAKADRAVLAALAIAIALVNGGERVALIGSNDRPSAGRFAIDKLIDGLFKQIDRDPGSMPGAEALPQAACVVLISDFLEPLDTLQAKIHAIAANQVRGVALHLIDPAEAAFPYHGRVLFEGLEGEGSMLIRHSATIKTRYQSLFDAHRRQVRAILAQCGWTAHHHDTGMPPETALLAAYQSLAPKLAA